ncbi:helical backbone metal receptor [Rubrivirga sp. S365]|uniref:Helical backbone metal receptor n=1 Tax=Rubrivirga litoralis TaxID=3075598 RepID=A0ABU3BP66_9BACT|nr:MULTISPECIES: helical backbone metal receptor [unclassified Rubrivirga]MDT0631025.1 helical backbone metal receptor [Rubrivirga sp. F394]MDT7855051.1 helical backbone metal receptor [Rubrivirga sp. S365]
MPDPSIPRTDALGRPVRLAAPPRRIVSLVPSQTELLADLELDDEVVGLTRFCVHPDGWKAAKTIVGGTKNVNVERVRGLRPDLVIANKEENVREQVEAVAAFCPVYVTDVADVDGAVAMIRDVGALVGRAARAGRIADEVEGGFAALAAAPPASSPPASSPPRTERALYLIWRDPWMAVGGDTIISDVLERGGWANATSSRDRYPTLSDQDIDQLAPDVVMLSSEPYPFQAKHVAEVQALAPAARVVLVDGEAFSWYGSRLRHTPAVLRTLRAGGAEASGADR